VDRTGSGSCPVAGFGISCVGGTAVGVTGRVCSVQVNTRTCCATTGLRIGV
jgi:hypothetical protein